MWLWCDYPVLTRDNLVLTVSLTVKIGQIEQLNGLWFFKFGPTKAWSGVLSIPSIIYPFVFSLPLLNFRQKLFVSFRKFRNLLTFAQSTSHFLKYIMNLYKYPILWVLIPFS